MLTDDENERLTRTDAGTPMGELLRRYWLPALLSRELPEPDGPPVRVKLLGEELVAFRDSLGRVGLLEEYCPHRRVSLWLGRNEECGLRCVYHGWKFDVEGACVDQMNEPGRGGFETRPHTNEVRATAYPTLEMGDIVWTYMGPKELQPPPPCFEFTQVPESHRNVTRTWQECNWLQGLEGGVDISHVPILHRLLANDADGAGYPPSAPFVRSGGMTLEIETTDYGFRYASIRPLEDDGGDEGQYVRAYHFVMPFTQIRPQQFQRRGGYKPLIAGHWWVPMDDLNCMVWNWVYSFGEEPLTGRERSLADEGNSLEDLDPANNFRKLRNKDNAWMIDRQAQKTRTFTGIEGVNTQDHAVLESMGPIADRTREHLGPSDRTIIVTRHLLERAVRAVEDGGDPPGLAPTYYRLRGIERILPHGVDWWEAMQDALGPSPDPTTSLPQAGGRGKG